MQTAATVAEVREQVRAWTVSYTHLMGLTCTFVAPDCSDEELEAAFRPNTKLVFGETIANPALAVLDIERFATDVYKRQLVNFYSTLIVIWCLLTWIPMKRDGLLADIAAVKMCIRDRAGAERTLALPHPLLEFFLR